MDGITVDMELDCRGMSCPIPILKTKKAIDTLQSGQVLRMISTDPGSIKDVEVWTRRTGNQLLNSEKVEMEYFFVMKKK